MIRKTTLAWTGGLLFGAAASLAAGFPGAVPARAQEWSTEFASPPPVPARKLSRPAAARAAAKAQRSGAAADKAPSAEPVGAEPPAPAEAAATAPAAAPAPAPTPEPPAATVINAHGEEEPDDPYVDLKVVHGLNGDVLTTQVAPNEPSSAAADVIPAEGTAAAQYCTNIADAAIDARIAWQRQNLAEAEKQLQQRTTELLAKTAEFQQWLARRNDFAEKAKKSVVDIYTKMKPDAAALQIQSLDEETAAALIIKLDPRTASAVMNEMDATIAARLTGIISGAAKLPKKPKAPPAQGNAS